MKVVELEAEGAPEQVSRVAGRFGAMVNVPSEIRVVIVERRETPLGEAVFFEVRNAAGGLAIRDGVAFLNRRSASALGGQQQSTPPP